MFKMLDPQGRTKKLYNRDNKKLRDFPTSLSIFVKELICYNNIKGKNVSFLVRETSFITLLTKVLSHFLFLFLLLTSDS